jgi:asparagine synthase (glutamine-hydrolysing)
MCGIFLVFSKNKRLDSKKCINSAKNLFNRGPDILKYNFFLRRKLFISNTILSLTGHSNKNRNLYFSKSKKFTISFNGEIYNYINLKNNYLNNYLKSKDPTDTEVLVNLHDLINISKIPKLINGMFVYLIYSNKENKITVYNDPQGEKSVYYFNDKNFFIISSTIENILKFIKNYQINIPTLKKYFATRHFMPLEETCFKKIKLLKNATKLEYNLLTNKLSTSIYDDPFNWVSKKKYTFFKSLKENEVVSYFENALNQQLNLMVPKINFGCIASGGIDSTLQAKLISNIASAQVNLVINHPKKDKLIKKLKNFNQYLQPNITSFSLSKKNYVKNTLKAYKIISSPLHTHDLGGRIKIAQIFKEKNCKIFFSADGCDELFGGQQLYYNLFYKLKKHNTNQSPYSSTFKRNFYSKDLEVIRYNKFLKKNWKKINKKYFFLKKKERNIQSSLFLDYFIQSTNVANRSNDLISSNYSIEARNAYIQKNILKIIINLPLEYKINFKVEKLMKQKFLLKKIFLRYFNKKLIFKKEGFSGFPESLTKVLKNKDFFITKKLLNINNIKSNLAYYDKKNYKRDIIWKLTNTEFFLKNHMN